MMMDDAQAACLLEPLVLNKDDESQTPLLFPDQQISAESGRGLSDIATQLHNRRIGHDDEIDELMQLFGVPYIRSYKFWPKCVTCIVIGFFVGCASAAFFALLDLFKIGPLLVTMPNEHNYVASRLSTPGKLGYREGDWRWLITTTLGSVLAGLILALRPVKRNTRNLFMEIRDLDPELMAAPFKILSCFISLLSGASLGPEAVLAILGSVLGSVLSTSFRVPFAEHKSLILSGIAGALGVIFPSPVLGVLCAVEISILTSREPFFNFEKSNHLINDIIPPRQDIDNNAVTQEKTPGEYHKVMEQITLMGITATVASLTLNVFRDSQSSPVTEVHRTQVTAEDDKIQLFTQTAHSALLGCLCGLLGTSYLILQGIFKTIAQRLSRRLPSRFGVTRYWLVALMFPFLTGVIFGCVAVVSPLTLGSGHEFIGWLLTLWKKNPSAKFIQNGLDEVLTAHILLVSAFLKLLTTAACLGFGMFGGQIIPLVVAGVYFGFAVAFYLPFLSVPLSVACCSIGIAGSFVPIPFTLVGTIATLGVSGVSSVPVFVSILCAFATNAGLGVVVAIAKRKSLVSGHRDASDPSARCAPVDGVEDIIEISAS